MSDDLGKAVTETIELYHLEMEGESHVVGQLDTVKIDDRLVVYHRPKSVESEYFRFLKSRIEQEFAGPKNRKKGRVVMFTGPNLAAGKTTISINLALAFARSYGEKTLFMDVDSRKSTSREYLGIREEYLAGFTDILNMKAKTEQVLLNSGMFDMAYLPSGLFSETFLDNLSSQQLSVLLENLRSKFKYIVIDAPPAFPMPEPAILAPHCDGVFIVLKAGRDGPNDLTQALEALEGSKIMGIILNGVKKTPGQRYGAYGYYGKGRS